VVAVLVKLSLRCHIWRHCAITLTFLVTWCGIATAQAAGVPPAIYDYREQAEGMTKEVRLAIPAGLGTVRGILVFTNAAGGDTRDDYRQPWHEEFLYLHGFAFLGTKGFTSHVESFEVLTHALGRFAQDSSHPEIEWAPFAVYGFSAGGGFASRLLREAPERVIAAVICSSFLRVSGTPAQLRTPVCLISGELESRLGTALESTLPEFRRQDAQYAWMTVQGFAHQWSGQRVLALPMLDAVVRQRYPADRDPRAGPVQLAAIPASSSWIADNTTYKSGLTKICPVEEFRGDLGKSSWLPSKDLAFIYRAYATYDNPLRIVSPEPIDRGGRVHEPGTDLRIVVDDSKFAGWVKLECFDGAKRIAELLNPPARLTIGPLEPGFHSLSILGTDPKGQFRCSSPVLIVVRAPR
jgi:pimeloyl-ACP methyl ester carboxylesterase